MSQWKREKGPGAALDGSSRTHTHPRAWWRRGVFSVAPRCFLAEFALCSRYSHFLIQFEVTFFDIDLGFSLAQYPDLPPSSIGLLKCGHEKLDCCQTPRRCQH